MGVLAVTWPDSRKYVGEFKDDRMHGIGKCELMDSAGVCGQRELVCSLQRWPVCSLQSVLAVTLPDNRTYDGGFENDKMHGMGTREFCCWCTLLRLLMIQRVAFE